MHRETPQAVLADAQRLIGLDKVKAAMDNLHYAHTGHQHLKSAFALPAAMDSLHAVLTGNPGTGKSELARLYARLIVALGLVRGRRYLEAGREDLVAGYVGQTEEKVKKLLKKADIIFIDEAYSLAGKGTEDYGANVVDALMLALENRRHDLVVLFAGYPDEMEKLISSNPGLRGRISTYFHLQDYTPEEMGKILDKMLADSKLKMGDNDKNLLLQRVEEARGSLDKKEFGNARIIRTFVKKAHQQLHARLGRLLQIEPDARKSLTLDGACTITREDIDALDFSDILGVKKKTTMGFALSKAAGPG